MDISKGKIKIELEAVIGKVDLGLSEVLGWKTGSKFKLNRSADGTVSLECANTFITQGIIRAEGNVLTVETK